MAVITLLVYLGSTISNWQYLLSNHMYQLVSIWTKVDAQHQFNEAIQSEKQENKLQTVTSLWRTDDASDGKISTAMPVVK